jgi:hypothetical protein
MLTELKKEWQLQMEQNNMKKPQKAAVQQVQETFSKDAEPVLNLPSPRSVKKTVRSATKTRLVRKHINPNL